MSNPAPKKTVADASVGVRRSNFLESIVNLDNSTSSSSNQLSTSSSSSSSSASSASAPPVSSQSTSVSSSVATSATDAGLTAPPPRKRGRNAQSQVLGLNEDNLHLFPLSIVPTPPLTEEEIMAQWPEESYAAEEWLKLSEERIAEVNAHALARQEFFAMKQRKLAQLELLHQRLQVQQRGESLGLSDADVRILKRDILEVEDEDNIMITVETRSHLVTRMQGSCLVRRFAEPAKLKILLKESVWLQPAVLRGDLDQRASLGADAMVNGLNSLEDRANMGIVGLVKCPVFMNDNKFDVFVGAVEWKVAPLGLVDFVINSTSISTHFHVYEALSNINALCGVIFGESRRNFMDGFISTIMVPDVYLAFPLDFIEWTVISAWKSFWHILRRVYTFNNLPVNLKSDKLWLLWLDICSKAVFTTTREMHYHRYVGSATKESSQAVTPLSVQHPVANLTASGSFNVRPSPPAKPPVPFLSSASVPSSTVGQSALCMQNLTFCMKIKRGSQPIFPCPRHCKYYHGWKSLGKSKVLAAVDTSPCSWIKDNNTVKQALMAAVRRHTF